MSFEGFLEISVNELGGPVIDLPGSFLRIQEGSPQGRFATKLEGTPQLWKVRNKCHRKVRHNVRMHYKTSYYCLLNVKIYLFHYLRKQKQ